MDSDPPLLHLHARLGGRRRRRGQETDAQAETARLDPEQSGGPSHHKLQSGLEEREGAGCSGGQLRSR